jgi:hypothetical protein
MILLTVISKVVGWPKKSFDPYPGRMLVLFPQVPRIVKPEALRGGEIRDKVRRQTVNRSVVNTIPACNSFDIRTGYSCP